MRVPPGYVRARPHPAPFGRTPELDRAIRSVVAFINQERFQSDYALVR